VIQLCGGDSVLGLARCDYALGTASAAAGSVARGGVDTVRGDRRACLTCNWVAANSSCEPARLDSIRATGFEIGHGADIFF
jgi:hypothetical protein